ncbi:DENN domain-containing protein 1B isoform X1 [Poecilia reticulata]|uniref:DENN domain-containing protein 1B isoform X1 n=1 Tax=Poecilia reticulata TaxID=8081 RepID=UPI0004A25A53|nr:PREDICTED: DENN domain-containing protein 1B isoform X1 [Poecilia reticulata]
MDSRIKENPERTFDLVVQVACPSSENEDPTVLWSFPQDHTDQEVLQTIPKFCFPFDVERVSQNQVGQNFTFVLTDIDSKQRFGFCRLTQGCRVCICLLSYLPWFEIYYKLLNTLADYLTKQQENDLNDLLNSLYELPVPKPFTPVNLSVNERLCIATGQVLRDQPSKEPHSYFIAPDINGLPTIPESRNLTEYFVAVDINNMLQLYASMLHERRIIITSRKLSTLTACVHGAAALLFPMYWQHIFIPVLPPHLLDYCCAPMPYFVGVHYSLLERVRSRSLEDVVILNVDTNTLETPFDDLHNLPSDVVSALKGKLKKQSTATGSGVARAFLRAQAALFGSYRDALRYKPGEPITFCEESFANHRSSTMKNFLSMAVNLQLFKQFIDGRLAKLNAGRGFTDVFEEEITEGGFCGSNSRSYQQWMHTVKRGGAFFNTAVSKAKVHAKRGIRDFKGRLKAREDEEDGMTVRPGSPTSTKSLSPRRLQKMRRHNLNKSPMSVGPRDLGYGLDDDELDTASKISSEDSGEVRSYTEDSDDSDSFYPDNDPSPSSQMNLLEEILDSLTTTTTMDQGKLSAAKSLDFFRSMDDLDDFKVQSKPSPCSHSAAADDSSFDGGADHGGWNMGQDDSAVHGKHLPPSPRRQPNKSSLKGSRNLAAFSAVIPCSDFPPSLDANGTKSDPPPLFSSKSRPDSHLMPSGRPPGDHRLSYSPLLLHKVTPPSPPASQPDSSPEPTSRSRTISDPQRNSEPSQTQNQTGSTGILRRKVMSKEMVKNYHERSIRRQRSRGNHDSQTSPTKSSQVQVPWNKEEEERKEEKEAPKDKLLGFGLCLGQCEGSETAGGPDPGLLEEIESMCCLSSSLHSSLHLSQVHCSNSHHQVQGKATEKS